ncbi:hypothetical protein A4H97_03655 [Niastella yeongjuensis]|uniref:Uncharacterized protein n=1 Tax=Niastella yeongjuensis TaxID=354355 RepID=A0A1V9EXT5_9BACT|nr:hypothetical protein [Niastella yeongjuensis]OQP50931.1 hypothetical protein A4H97_03655 [Niastella yeongjuensis]SEN10892.1 hypothetical protein SAMN05660816_00208 [Niastella yeongjuensis]
MENAQPIQPVKQDERIKREAEKLFQSFWNGIISRKPVGLLTEMESGQKIFSFESYLRETGKGEYVEAYCSHIKSADIASDMVTFTNMGWARFKGGLSLLGVLLLILLPGILLYLLIVAFLATFSISFWGWLPAVLFALTGPVMVAILFIPTAKQTRQESRASQKNLQYIIKNFDNDELTFLRTKSKLFK